MTIKNLISWSKTTLNDSKKHYIRDLKINPKIIVSKKEGWKWVSTVNVIKYWMLLKNETVWKVPAICIEEN